MLSVWTRSLSGVIPALWLRFICGILEEIPVIPSCSDNELSDTPKRTAAESGMAALCILYIRAVVPWYWYRGGLILSQPPPHLPIDSRLGGLTSLM